MKAAPDGSTIGVVSNNHVTNPSVYRNLPFDSLADITPIAVIGSTPFVLVVNPAKLSATNVKELVVLPSTSHMTLYSNLTALDLAARAAGTWFSQHLAELPTVASRSAEYSG